MTGHGRTAAGLTGPIGAAPQGAVARAGTLLALLALLAVPSLPAGCLAVPADGPVAGGGLARVDSLLAAGAWQRAADLARTGLGARPELTADAWQWRERLARALEGLDRRPEAVAQLEAAIAAAPGVAALHAGLARILMAMGRPGRALGEYEEAAALAPRDWRLALDHARVLLRFGQQSRAVERLRQADRLCGGCPEAARDLAGALLAGGDFAGALPPLRRLQQAEPTAWSRRALALALLRTGDPGAARDLLAPAWPDSLTDEGRRLLLEADAADDRSDHALQAVRRPDLPGASAGFWGAAGLLLLRAERPEEALVALDRALALAPDDPVHLNNRVVALTRLGRDAEARREYERLQALLPDSLADRP